MLNERQHGSFPPRAILFCRSSQLAHTRQLLLPVNAADGARTEQRCSACAVMDLVVRGGEWERAKKGGKSNICMVHGNVVLLMLSREGKGVAQKEVCLI